jgi:4-amino-4-deoxy-L-arabinose transferase-like glycosyltransferase
MQQTTKPVINRRSIALLVLAWLILQIGGLFTPGLLDDVDSIYIEIAREMLHRHDFITPYIDGIRFFDKPPLMYWMAAASMKLLGEFDWAARLPLALSVLALLFSVYALGLRLYAQVSPTRNPDRGALYAGLAMATSIGPYLYTRFFIPDILICLWMTLGVHLFLIALDRAAVGAKNWLPSIGFAAVLALNLLTKGLIGLVFPLGFVFFYLLLTRQFRLIGRLHLLASLAVFLAIALPWHVLAALRNPAIAMPAGVGLPPYAGWAWFYLYNEHVARFLSQRIPQDYGTTPRWLFWLYAFIWMLPWAAFLPAAIAGIFRDLGHRFPVTARRREAALTVALWALIVLGFFTASTRQEYYSLPALPALALMIGGVLAKADSERSEPNEADAMGGAPAFRAAVACHRWVLLPIACLVASVCAFLAVTAPKPAPGADLAALLASNPDLYNQSLGHIFDLTGAAMGLFRWPLTLVAIGFVVIGPASYLYRRRGRGPVANLLLAGGMTLVLLAAHEGLVRFNPILGSKTLAEAIVRAENQSPQPGDLILIDGELTSGSTLLFYTRQPVHLVNGRVNGPWFGSFWPDAPPIFEDEQSLRRLWGGPRRVFLMTPVAASRTVNLAPFGPVRIVASAGGKTVLSNR